MCDTVFKARYPEKGRPAEWSDELVNKFYYSFLETIKNIEEHYKETEFRHRGRFETFIKDSETTRLLNELPFDWDESISNIKNVIIKSKFKERPSELAIASTARTIERMAEYDERLKVLTEDRIRKKIKKIYKK
jgi:hypothetical protein